MLPTLISECRSRSSFATVENMTPPVIGILPWGVPQIPFDVRNTVSPAAHSRESTTIASCTSSAMRGPL